MINTDQDVLQYLGRIGQQEDFQILMMEYQCAIYEVKTKLDVLNAELSVRTARNPLEIIQTRLKSPLSIYNKLRSRGFSISVDSMEENLNDIAGVRVVCSFIDDIYKLKDYLVNQDDVKLLEEKDYLAKPKQNGYRSLHIIIEIPIFLTSGKKFRRVEVQFRTIAMEFWASLEHKLKYKKDIRNADAIAEELGYSAEMINQLDRRMQQIRRRIDGDE